MISSKTPSAAVYPGSSLEQSIDHYAMVLATAATPEARRAAWDVLCELIHQRSPERVREMEEAQGLIDKAFDRIDATRIHQRLTVDEFLG
jgi:uncharacterized protein YifN (PemK superfamily)